MAEYEQVLRGEYPSPKVNKLHPLTWTNSAVQTSIIHLKDGVIMCQWKDNELVSWSIDPYYEDTQNKAKDGTSQ